MLPGFWLDRIGDYELADVADMFGVRTKVANTQQEMDLESMASVTPQQLFQLKNDFTKEDLKKRYRALAKEFHPDMGKYKNSHEAMQIVNDAMESLRMQLEHGETIEDKLRWDESKSAYNLQKAEDFADEIYSYVVDTSGYGRKKTGSIIVDLPDWTIGYSQDFVDKLQELIEGPPQTFKRLVRFQNKSFYKEFDVNMKISGDHVIISWESRV